MRNFSLISIAIITFMFLFSSIEAQTVLNGLIMDNKNEPVEFANIVFFSMPDTVFVTGTTSLKDGSFGLTIHTPGSYLLQISFIGYKKHHQEITIREGNITLPAIILEEESQALNEIKQDVKEETENNELLTQMNSLSRYTIYAARYAANYHPSEKHAIIAGADVSRINGEGDMTTEPALVGYLNYKSKETKWAVFTEYNWTNTKLSLNTGLRYEVLSSMYDDLPSVEDNVKKKYHNIFPSFKISYSDKGVNNSLSFSVRTQRPQLSYLNSKTYYQNRFMHQQGNPKLKPQTSYILQWISGYKFLNFTASYTRTDDFISSIFTNPEDGQNIIISTWDNFDKACFLRTTLNLRQTFNRWTTSLTLGFIKPYMENEYKGTTTTYNKPNYYLSSNNYFKLPSDYTLSVNYYYNHGGSQRIFEFKPFQSLDIKIQKPFFNERLSVDIGAKDIFRKLKYEENAQFNNVRFYQIENYSPWNFFIDVIYRFNQQKVQYRGKSAARDEINRL